MKTLLILLIVIVVLALLAGMVMAGRKRQRTSGLKQKFGPEYDRTVAQTDDRKRAEAELASRQERREQLNIRDLDPAERERYANSWRDTQVRFVDTPREAIREADLLVTNVMRERGYPMNEFDQRAADISVDHPQLVEDYRFAHEVSLRNERGEATTEDLRRAMVRLRSLFEELLGRDHVGEAGADRGLAAPLRPEDQMVRQEPAESHTVVHERQTVVREPLEEQTLRREPLDDETVRREPPDERSTMGNQMPPAGPAGGTRSVDGDARPLDEGR